jgi:O-antigen/teichoic acid export membrane protein
MVFNNLTLKTIGSSSWNFLGYFFRKIIGTLSLIILARLLLKSDFGLISAVSVILNLVGILREMGLSAFLIYQKEKIRTTANLIFFLNIISGFIVYLLLFLGAELAASFYQKPIITPLLRTFGLTILMEAYIYTHLTLFAKELQFKKRALAEGLSAFFGFTMAILLAFYKYGVWSLIFGNLGSSLVNALFVRSCSSFHPKWEFDFSLLKKIFRYSHYLVWVDLTNFVSFHLTYFIIGRYLGVEALGIFTMACNLAEWTSVHFIYILSRVAFPIFSKIQDNKSLLKKSYLKMVEYTSFLTVPALAGLFLLASHFVLSLYGERWQGVIVILKILLFRSLFRSIFILITPLLKALGHPGLIFKVNLSKFLLSLPLYLFAVRLGLLFFTVIVATVQFLADLFIILKTYRLIELSLKEVLSRIKFILLSSSLMAGTILISQYFLSLSALYRPLQLVFLSFFNGGVYFLLLRQINPTLFKEMKKIGRQLFVSFFNQA